MFPFPLLSPPVASRALGTWSHKCLFPCLPCLQSKSHLLLQRAQFPAGSAHTGHHTHKKPKAEGRVMIPFNVLQVTSLKTLGASSQDSFPFNLEASKICEPYMSVRYTLYADVKREIQSPNSRALSALLGSCHQVCPTTCHRVPSNGSHGGSQSPPSAPKLKAEFSIIVKARPPSNCGTTEPTSPGRDCAWGGLDWLFPQGVKTRCSHLVVLVVLLHPGKGAL